MGKSILSISVLILIFLCSAGHSEAGGMYFIQNRGQWAPEVLFRAEIPGGFLFLKTNSLVYVLYDAKAVSARHAKGHNGGGLAREASLPAIKAHGVEVQFLNASRDVAHTPARAVPAHFNYFLEKDESRWASGAGGFEEVRYRDLYPGIDLRVYTHQLSLKYEFIVHPKADPSVIRLQYAGAEKVELDDQGQVLVQTSVGHFREAKPYSFQLLNGRTSEVSSGFSVSGNQAHFVLPKGYDKSQTLTIDPELIFSTYSGSVSDNWGHTATYDDAGHLYSGGTVFGSNFPVTTGAFQVKFEGQVDVAIMKFSPDGSQLLYATFLGGASTDVPSSLIVNSRNELHVLGTTSSKNFPTRTNAFQPGFGGGTRVVPISGLDLSNGADIFISKFSADGKQLLGSTYLGGDGNDGISNTRFFTIRNYGDAFRGEIVLDKSDNILIVSTSNSGNFPLKNHVQDRVGGTQDAVISKFDTGLTTLLWSTYFGGEKEEAGYSLKSVENGDIYVTGVTSSTLLPTSSASFQSAFNGMEDAFIARFSNDKMAAVTYMGTAKADAGYSIDTDPAGNVYVYGLTNGEYPVSAGVYKNEKSGQFIHAVDATLSKSVLSTTIGSGRGTPDISPTAFLVSECGNIYIAGWGGNVNAEISDNPESSTNNLPVTEDAIKPTTNGSNFYIAILEEGAKSLLYATYFGSASRSGDVVGDHVDGGTSRFDKNGIIYHATCACGGNYFPVTPQAWSKTNNSDNCNNAAFKIDIDRLEASFDVYAGTTKDVTRGCAPLALSFINTSEGGVDYIWEVSGNIISREDDAAQYNFTVPGEYTVTLTAYNRLSCKRVDVAQKKIIVETLAVDVMQDTTVCENTTLKLYAAGGTKYQWSPSAGMDNAASATPAVTVQESTDFSVEISNNSGCKVTEHVNVKVDKKTDFVALPDVEVCAGAAVTLTVSGEASQYNWLPADGLNATTGSSVTVRPDKTTTYVVQGVYPDGCKPIRKITVNVDRGYEPVFEVKQSGGACNEPFRYTFSSSTSNADKYEWDLGNGSNGTGNSVSEYQYEVAGEYVVTLTTYNAAGCSLSASRKITAAPPFTLANVITPNKDGKNDLFIVPVSGSTVEVFNRWGKSVFKTADYQNDWGSGIANGTYYYVVDTPQGNHCKGWVEVIE